MIKRQVVLESISALLIMLFLYASASKFLDFNRFIGEMNNQRFPAQITPIVIWAVPLSEIAIAAALLFEPTRMIGLIASLILMSLFTIYTATVLLHFFKYVPCSCGGVISKLTWKQHLVFNLFFVALSIAGIYIQRQKSFKSIFTTKNSFV